MTQLRDYQKNVLDGIYREWEARSPNVLAVMPTGAGKTVLFSEIMAAHRAPSVAIAHRAELVVQISLALGRAKVRHSLLAPKATARAIVQMHMAELGANWYDPSARTKVAGVDTLVRMDASDPWFASVGLWVQDEAHHVLAANKWGRAAAMFPNARGLGVTATPMRADGKGLGRHHDGVFDAMVLGPQMRTLIERGYLTEYRVLLPENDIDLAGVQVSSGGDFRQDQLTQAVHKSRIVGDVVATYLEHARGKRGVTFAVDVEHATEMAAAYNAAGVPAAVLHGETPDAERLALMRQFRAGTILQLCNCDLLGEGVDVPAIEVVSFARPTMSYGLFVQQFGRALRKFDGKQTALILDHVGNVLRHGLPDKPRTWSLNRRERTTGATDTAGVIPLRRCLSCMEPFERLLSSCPYCGTEVIPVGRTSIEQVDGRLRELSPEVLARMRGDVERVDGAATVPWGASAAVAGSVQRRHWERQQAQKSLREAIMLYGGVRHAAGDTDDMMQSRFWHVFGVDVLGAQALGAAEAAALEQRVRATL